MFQHAEVRMIVVGDHANDAAQTVEDERTEVGSQRDGEQGIRERCHLVMGRVPETRKQPMRQCLDRSVLRSAGIAESHRYRNDADKAGNYGQRPDGAVGAQVLLVEHAEVFRHLIVFAHGVGHARTRVEAGERRADECQEDGDCFNQVRPCPWPNKASPVMIIMSPMGAAEPAALAMV